LPSDGEIVKIELFALEHGWPFLENRWALIQ